MATLQRIAFFLVCVFVLQEIQTQSNFQLSEGSSSSSSSTSEAESYKKELNLLKDKTSYVMGQACSTLRAINVSCEVGSVGRRFMGKIVLDIAYNFVHAPIRVLYAVAYLCEKMVKCISKTTQNIAATVVNSLPPCIQKATYAVNDYLKSSLEVITEILRTVSNFAKDVTSCTLSLVECIKTVFDNIFSSVIKIIRAIIVNTTGLVVSILRLNKPGCPTEEPESTPKFMLVRCSKCVFCTFQPTSPVCKTRPIF